MNKITRYFLILAVFAVLLSACAGQSVSGTNTNTSSVGAPAVGASGQQDTAGVPQQRGIEAMLAVGILQLEDTSLAITSDQAKTLLPLWKAVKSLSSSDITAQEEIDSVYAQIEESMTAEQIQAIKDSSLSPENTQTLMEKYGIEMPQFNGDGNFNTEDFSARATQQAAEGGGFPGGGPGGGEPGGEPGGGFPGEGRGNIQGMEGMPQIEGTPGAGMTGMPGRGGLNNMWIDPLIKLLEERANT